MKRTIYFGYNFILIFFTLLIGFFLINSSCSRPGGDSPTLVSISVIPANPLIARGTSLQLTALGLFSNNTTQDLTTQVLWSSSNAGNAIIGISGLATGRHVGSTTIRASYGGITSSPAVLTVPVQINLPKTGQVTCYDASGNVISCTNTGQDGDTQKGVAWPNPRFTVGTGAAVDCVSDNLTGLMWVMAPDSTRGTWQDALGYATTLNTGGGLCGYTDWRMPNKKELRSLIDYSMTNPSLPSGHPFAGVQGDMCYWSSTSYTYVASFAWCVHMSGMSSGAESQFEKTDNRQYLWPVRSVEDYTARANLPTTGQTTCYDLSGNVISCTNTGQDGDVQKGVAWTSPRFTVDTAAAADCITDNMTGLMWIKHLTPYKRLRWQEALDYVATINSSGGLCGYADWRMPNINELASLVNLGPKSPADWLNNQGFSNVEKDVYWSSTSYTITSLGPSGPQSSAWVVDMSGGVVRPDLKQNGKIVWPVRGGSTLPVTPPSTPTGVIWLAGDELIVVGWNESTGAASYNLYMATAPGVTRSTYRSLPNGIKHAGINSPFTLTGLTNRTSYYFVVTAVNGAGESGESSESSTWPWPAPGDVLNYFPMNIGNTWTYSGTESIAGKTPVSYTNVSAITGTTELNGAIARVWRDSNPWNEGNAIDGYYLKNSSGLIYLGNNDINDIFDRQLVPYWGVIFNLTAGYGNMLINKTGMDLGEDIDHDGINETVDVNVTATVISSSETVTVSAGTFANSVKIKRHIYYLVTYSKTNTKANITNTETLWTAPGVGIIKWSSVVVRGGGSDTRNEELTSYAVH